MWQKKSLIKRLPIITFKNRFFYSEENHIMLCQTSIVQNGIIYGFLFEISLADFPTFGSGYTKPAEITSLAASSILMSN